MSTPVACRICQRSLEKLYVSSFSPSEGYYVCECGAINPVRRLMKSSSKKHLKLIENEWTPNVGFVDEKEKPIRVAMSVGKRPVDEDRIKEAQL